MLNNLYTEDTSLLDLAHNNSEYEKLIEQFDKKINVTKIFMNVKEFISQEKERVKKSFILPIEIEIGGDFNKGYGINFTEYKKSAYDMLTMGQNSKVSDIINHAIKQHLIEKPSNFSYNESEFSSAILNNLSSGVALKKYEKYLTDELARIELENLNRPKSIKIKWYKHLWVKLLGIVTFFALVAGAFDNSCNLLDRFNKKENQPLSNIDTANNLSVVSKERKFNTDTRDLATVLVANHTTNPCDAGSGIGCFSSSVAAKTGDTIVVQLYCHNTSNEIIHNVSLRLKLKNTDSDTLHQFVGEILINGIPNIISNAFVHLSFPSTLVFIPESVRHCKNQGQPKLVGHNETDFFSNQGLIFDKIEPGWNSQGTISASFQVK